MLSSSISYPDLIKKSLLCGYHWKIGGESRGDGSETEGDFTDNSIVKTISHNNQKQVMIV
jgi:hypothetical protein